jgi:hypothetical protein
MTRTRVLAAAATALLAAPMAAEAAGIRAPLRVETTQQTIVGHDNARVGAARAYLDTDGAAHALPANTALGQLVAGTAASGADVGIGFNAQFGGFVASIGGRAPGATGTWAFFVDNELAQTGAETTFLKRKSEYVWVLDPDFTKRGPFFLALDAVKRGRAVTFTVTRAGAGAGTAVAKPAPAKGAALVINDTRVRIPESGRVTVDVTGEWSARATMAGTIASETLSGTS